MESAIPPTIADAFYTHSSQPCWPSPSPPAFCFLRYPTSFTILLIETLRTLCTTLSSFLPYIPMSSCLNLGGKGREERWKDRIVARMTQSRLITLKSTKIKFGENGGVFENTPDLMGFQRVVFTFLLSKFTFSQIINSK